MPTALPARPTPERRLLWPQAGRLMILVARVRWLDVQLHVLAGRGADFHDDRLLRLMQRWLAADEAIGAILPGMPEPEHLGQVRAILAGLGQPIATVDCTRRAP